MTCSEAGLAGSPPYGSTYTDRSCPPEETLRRVTPYLQEYGVTRLARLTGLDDLGIPVWNAVVPNSRSIVINQGKGITDLDAQVSAAMEALERAVACSPIDPARQATRRSLLYAGERALALPELIARDQPDLGDDEDIGWLQGQDLRTGETVWVPRDAVLLDRTQETCRYWQSSDGLASGNTREEAIFHGMLERIERDAEILWRMLPQPSRLRKAVHPASFGDPVLDDMSRRIESAGLCLRLFDITSDIGTPCFSALLAPSDILSMTKPRFVDVTAGHGAHPSALRAAIRAVTEAAQSRLTYISGARDDVFPETFIRPLPEDIRLSFRATPALRDYGRDAAPAGSIASLNSDLLGRLASAKIKTVIAVSLAKPDLPFAVVKIIIPELENPDGARKRRFGPRALSQSLLSL
jgi:YcaO-like protein with predicted kinase domain